MNLDIIAFTLLSKADLVPNVDLGSSVNCSAVTFALLKLSMSNLDSGLFEEGSAIAFPLEEGLTLDPESVSESESKSTGKLTEKTRLIISEITSPQVNLITTFL